METLFVLAAFVLVSLSEGQKWSAPAFCHQRDCPQFKVVGSNTDFEERLYVATTWISTKMESTDTIDVMAAYSRLKNYCQKQEEAGFGIRADTWPALVTATEGGGGGSLSMSWFVPAGAKLPEDTDESVKLQVKAEATVYVRAFSGTPSLAKGQDNMKILREAVAKAGKTFDPNTYAGAAYDNYFSLTHHNEVWVFAD